MLWVEFPRDGTCHRFGIHRHFLVTESQDFPSHGFPIFLGKRLDAQHLPDSKDPGKKSNQGPSFLRVRAVQLYDRVLGLNVANKRRSTPGSRDRQAPFPAKSAAEPQIAVPQSAMNTPVQLDNREAERKDSKVHSENREYRPLPATRETKVCAMGKIQRSDHTHDPSPAQTEREHPEQQ
jgi:hypothetical protein